MSFTEATKTCLGKYADFSGRAKRSEYWWFYLFVALATSVAQIIDNTIGTNILGNLTSLALFVPSIAVGARRLHDIGRSGWWQLIALTGVGVFVLIYWYIQDSRDEA